MGKTATGTELRFIKSFVICWSRGYKALFL